MIERDKFDRLVEFHAEDMRDLSGLALSAYDFIWSSCALEHLGSLEAGMDFMVSAMELLKPGGVAVHTTEINVASNGDTITSGDAVVYRRVDLENLDHRLRRRGMCLKRLDLFPGSEIHDRQFDMAPYYEHGRAHVKLDIPGHVCTSQLLVCYR